MIALVSLVDTCNRLIYTWLCSFKMFLFVCTVSDVCATVQCENGGTCVGLPDKMCECPTGWTGTYCRIGELKKFCYIGICLK